MTRVFDRLRIVDIAPRKIVGMVCCAYPNNLLNRIAFPWVFKMTQRPSDTVSSLSPSGMELIYAYLAARL